MGGRYDGGKKGRERIWRERRWREKGVGTILAGDTMAGSKIRVIILCGWRPLLGVAKYIKMNKNILKLLNLIIGRNK